MVSWTQTMSAQMRQQAGDRNPFNSRGLLADATTADIAQVENRVRRVLIQEAVGNISGINSQGDAVVRDILPALDLESGSANGWNGTNNEWTQAGLSANSWNEVYSVDSDAKADQKIISIFAVSNLTSSPATTEIRFLTGTGGTFERVQSQGLLVDEETTAMLADPLVFKANDNGSIETWVNNAQDTELVFHGAVSQPESTDLEESGRFISDITA